MDDETDKTPQSNRRTFLIGGAAALGATALAGVGTLSIPAVQRALTYAHKNDWDGNPIPPIEPPANYGLQGITEETLTNSRGEEFLLWRSEELKPDHKTLVIFPGNNGHTGADKGYYIDLMQRAQQQGYQVVAVNNVGFTGSKENPSLEGIFRGAEKSIDWLLEQGIKPNDMELFGFSMGTTTAAHAASHLADAKEFRKDPRATVKLLMVSGIIEVQVMLDEEYGRAGGKALGSIMHERFDTGRELQALTGNVMPRDRVKIGYICGDHDPYTPAGQLEAHAKAARGAAYAGEKVSGDHFVDLDQVMKMLTSLNTKDFGKKINGQTP